MKDCMATGLKLRMRGYKSMALSVSEVITTVWNFWKPPAASLGWVNGSGNSARTRQGAAESGTEGVPGVWAEGSMPFEAASSGWSMR